MDLHPDIAAVLAGERRWCVAHASMLDLLPLLPENSVDSVVTDCPYGLGKEPDVMRMLQAWLAGEAYTPNGKGGFMGREWDAFVPGPHYWRETFRVLKPGGHLVTFCGTRTVDLIGLALRIAGFEIRDGLEWLYGSGFPKSLDVSKKIDEAAGAERETIRAGASGKGVASISSYGDGLNVGFRARPATAPATAPAKEWHGWGTALKPGHEPIILARKPLTGTVAANVLAHGTGALNIGDCRVAHASPEDLAAHEAQVAAIKARGGTMDNSWKNSSDLAGANDVNDAGRWPPNFLLTHSASCRAIGTRAVKANPTWDTPNRATEPSAFTGAAVSKVQHVEDVVVEWECAPDCPVRELDGQSGESTSGGRDGVRSNLGYKRDGSPQTVGSPVSANSGAASRFFPQSQWDPQLDDIGEHAWRNQDLNRSAPTGSTSREKATSEGHSKADSASSTTSSGSDTTGPSRPVTRSTTSTKTSKTTASETSNSSTPQHTSDSTADASSETDLGGSHAGSAASSSQSTPSTGICPEKDARSTDGADHVTSEESSETSRLDEAPRFLYVAKASRAERDLGLDHFKGRSGAEATNSKEGQARLNSPRTGAGRTGKGGDGMGVRNPHPIGPTVKPVELLRWLVRLVTPPKGLVLDPFCGSGSCGMAAMLEGFRYLGIELNDTDEEPFASIARARITWIEGGNYVPRESLRAPKPPAQASLFAALGKAAAE